MSHLVLKNYYTYLFFIFAAFAVISCSHTAKVADEAALQKDSIMVWIAQAKDTVSPLKERLLNKAYSATLELPKDSLKAKHLVTLSYQYAKTSDTAAFRKINNEAIQLTEKLDDSSGLADVYWDLGDYLSDRIYKKDSGYYYYAKAQRLYEKTGNDFSSARMLINMAIEQINIKDYTGAEIHTAKAIRLLQPLKKDRQLYSCYNNLGIIFNNLGEYEKALEYYDQAREYLKKTNTGSKNALELITLNNKGGVYKNQENYKEAIVNYKKAQDKNLSEDPEVAATLIDNIAYAKFKMGDTTALPGMFYEALKIRDSLHIVPDIVISKLNLAEYYTTYKDTVTALKNVNEARELALSSNNPGDLLASLKLLSGLEKGEKRITHLNQYIKINDSLQKAERNTREKFTRLRLEMDELIIEYIKIKRTNEQQQIIIWVTFAALVFLTLGYVVVIQRNVNMRLMVEKKSKEAGAEIIMLKLSQNIKKEQGQQQERQRISEELHDGVLGKLFGARMTLESFNIKTDKESIEIRAKCIERLRQAEEEIRDVSHELNNEYFVAGVDYLALVYTLLQTQSVITKFEFFIDNNPDIIWESVSENIKLNLYRILQEAVHNIHKYAKAKSVYVSFGKKDANLLMIVGDDGVGFDMTVKKSVGIGLKNMRSRVANIKGKIVINSVINEGTTIDITVPLNRKKPEQKFSFLKLFNIGKQKKDVKKETEPQETA